MREGLSFKNLLWIFLVSFYRRYPQWGKGNIMLE